jgi:hypothetical protein
MRKASLSVVTNLRTLRQDSCALATPVEGRRLASRAPDGLIGHAAGEQPDGRWQAVSIWESEAKHVLVP